MIEIHGAPFDLGGRVRGSRLGPAAVRLAGLVPELSSHVSVSDQGDLHFQSPVESPENRGHGLSYYRYLEPVLQELQRRTQATLDRGNLPLMIGGEHTLSIAPVSVMAQKYGRELAVIWIDAHADLNNPASSPSGNPHGMPVAALTGIESGVTGPMGEEWDRLVRLAGGTMDPEQFTWIGLRDVDPGERGRIRALRRKAGYSMHSIDRSGIQEVWKAIDRDIRSWAHYLYISFDVDVLDPVLAPGVGTAVRGGLTYREAHLLAELMHESLQQRAYQLVGLDIVEVSPIHDVNNQTATIASEWVASLFGRTILGEGVL